MCNILPPRCPADILHNQSPYGPTVAACEGLYLRYTQQRRPFSTNMASTPNKTNMATYGSRLDGLFPSEEVDENQLLHPPQDPDRDSC